MTDHEFEIVKILLDKGLLGAIAVGAGYYFSRAIERYKAVQVYEQSLAEKRIEAFREVGSVLGAELVSVMSLALVLPEVRSGNEVAKGRYKTLVDQLQSSVSECQSLMGRHFLLLSEDARVALVKYNNDIVAFLATLKDELKHEDLSGELEAMKNRCAVSLRGLMNILDSGVQFNPFKKGGDWFGLKK
jgi:hypothetical protein